MTDWALFQLAGALYLIMPAVTWLAMSGRQTRAGNLWCLGGFLMGVGAILTGARGALPDWLAIHAGMVLFTFSSLARLEAVWIDLGRTLPRRAALAWAWLVPAVSALADWADWRALMVLSNRFHLALAMALLSLGLWALWKHRRSRNLVLMSGLYMVFAWLIMLSGLWPVWQGDARPDATVSPVLGWMALVGAGTAVFGHLAYLGYVFESSLKQRQAYDQDVSADQEVVALTRKLADLTVRAQAGQQAALVAHEVNQPLAAIQIQAQLAQRMLRKPTWSPEVVQDLLGKIDQQIERLQGWVERLRTQAPSPISVCAPEVPRQVLHETLDLLRLDPRWQGVAFHVTHTDTAPVALSASELTQLLFNLLRNAAEAVSGRPGATVHVGLLRQGEHLRLEVWDNGPGFDADILATLGRPFASTKPQGMGVGLAICLKLAQQAGGQLLAANLTPAGARVEAVLPMHN